MDDQLTALVKSVRQLGQELVETEDSEAGLRVAGDRMEKVSGDLYSYFYKLVWDKILEKKWKEAGMQSEEDAEYG